MSAAACPVCGASGDDPCRIEGGITEARHPQRDAVHRLNIRRHQRGKSPIGRGSPVYGCSGSCSGCDWKGRSNYAPSQGGRRELRHLHEQATGIRPVID